MKQIIQSYKTGKMEVVEVPVPNCGDNGVLVKTGASLISAGTEKMLIDIAGKSLVVTKSIPDSCFVAGVPAKVIKKFN